MTMYALFDSTDSAPQKIATVLDTRVVGRASLPPSTGLLALSDAQWVQWQSAPGAWAVSGDSLVPYNLYRSTPTLSQQATALLAGGLTITSTGTPDLDGVYACDTSAHLKLQAVQTYILANAKFPGSSGTYAWRDMSGTPHVFPSIAEFEAFWSRITDFVADCMMIELTGTGTLPATVATIP